MSVRKLGDILNANPTIRSLKNGRNALLDACFRSRGRARGEAFAARLTAEQTEQVCFTVAFNTPWVLDLLTAAWGKYCKSYRLVVIDNSSSAQSRAANRLICEARSVPYLGLPSNPEWSPNRSHGIAMNWIYYNIVRRLEPVGFGFIDHDCFPVMPFDIAAHLAGKSAYGLRKYSRRKEGAWNLWAGFCFYRYADTLAMPLDFKHRIEFGLDTGGGNWERFYSRLAEDDVAAATIDDAGRPLGESAIPQKLIAGAFLHLGGASYRNLFTEGDQRRLVAETIWRDYLDGCSPALDAG